MKARRLLKLSHKRLINETIKRDHEWDTLRIKLVLLHNSPVKRPFYGTIEFDYSGHRIQCDIDRSNIYW